MKRTQKAVVISLFLGIIFFTVNFMSHTASTPTIIFKSLLVALTFGVLYMLTFTLLDSEKHRIQYGVPLIIGVASGALIGTKLGEPIICTLIGIGIAVIVGYIYGRIKGVR
ncbi:hypothetical protein C7J88_05760 [Staphylococcus muscae]|uniref:Uncharacterized protein n=1 Tax=Staphylococcus muscae TaxID=1294 RepID=A0A240C9V8_9STAP|nr:hypothetical protein [Staphylococcus muscae]AVQ33697.1 hypothetical protein C7J88_05760 [Staphylococcus muscae]PNZ03640.1 hypothetical protein CD131_05915 [Staphylococcus muscae]GGA86988.1 hypothetical protein GCM10007183_08920 [Staphylococcus muscae]SNW04016.1 Uncharacterised protein [Staphylococcus muscae]